MNFIGMYTFDKGFVKGLRLGASTTVGWKTGMYYYYPLGVGVLTNRTMLYEPTETLINGIFGYSHKFKRITFSTQLNINNLFDEKYFGMFAAYGAITNGAPRSATLTLKYRF